MLVKWPHHTDSDTGSSSVSGLVIHQYLKAGVNIENCGPREGGQIAGRVLSAPLRTSEHWARARIGK